MATHGQIKYAIRKSYDKKIAEMKSKIRTALADYMSSEGCSCCQGSEHGEHARVLAKLLGVPKYEDGSGYDFSKFKTQK